MQFVKRGPLFQIHAARHVVLWIPTQTQAKCPLPLLIFAVTDYAVRQIGVADQSIQAKHVGLLNILHAVSLQINQLLRPRPTLVEGDLRFAHPIWRTVRQEPAILQRRQ